MHFYKYDCNIWIWEMFIFFNWIIFRPTFLFIKAKRESICPSHYFGGKEEQVRDRWRVFSIFGWYNNPKEVQLAEKWVKGLVFISGGLYFPWYKEKSTLLTFYTAGRMKQALFPWYLRDLISQWGKWDSHVTR